jgi:hypothetical protein
MTDSESNSAAPVEILGVEGAGMDPGSVSLAQVLAETDVVSVEPEYGYMVVARRNEEASREIQLREAPMSVGVATREMGYTSPSPFTSWTRRDDNTKLQGQSGIRVYYNMRRQDGAVRASQRLVKTPVQSAHWFIEPWSKDEHSEPTTQDQNVADFVRRNLFDELNVSWDTLLADILLMTDYGYIAFEKVWQFGLDGKLHLQKLAPRHPLDIQEWEYDANGGPNGCIMFPNPYSGPSPLTGGTGMDPQEEHFIPIEKLVVFTHEAEAGDLTGISILRSAYKHWYYKDTLYKIDAIQKERHGIGIPIITLPPGFTPTDQALADNLGRNLRTNERAHITLPPQWSIAFAKLEGQPVDCLKSIEHHDMRIKANVLGSFLDADSGTSDPNIDIFLKSTRYIADYICGIINKHVIKDMVDMNFALGATRGYPRLRARRIGEWEDLRTLSFAVRNLVGADVIRADDNLEAHLRREMDLPMADTASSRIPVIATPQSGTEGADMTGQDGQGGQASASGKPKQDAANNKPGMPRQTSKANVGTPAPNAGTDRSGGK